MKSRIEFKTFPLTYKVLGGLALSYLEKLIIPLMMNKGVGLEL